MCIGAGKLRSADCVAEGRVQVVVINKKDFMDLDNPLLAWMLDSDAVTTVLRVSAPHTLSHCPRPPPHWCCEHLVCWTLMLSPPSSGYVLLTHSHSVPPPPPRPTPLVGAVNSWCAGL